MSRTLRVDGAPMSVTGRSAGRRAAAGDFDRLGPDAQAITASLGDRTLAIEAAPTSDGGILVAREDGTLFRAVVTRAGDTLWVTVGGRTFRMRELEAGAAAASHHAGDLEAPMPGKVLEVRCAVGDRVAAGATLLVLEAMKMEHAITAPTAGTVTEVRVEAGALVSPGSPLVVVTPDAEEAA